MEMMKKLFTIIICICAVTAQAQKPNNEALRKLQMAEFAITNLYVDKVDEDKLVEEAIIKMLAQLDPHSTYNNAEEVKKMNEPLQGNFEGIGVQFQMIEDTLLVIQPVSNGPSEKVGILAGDRIVAVNDSAIAGVKMSTEDIMSRLRGPTTAEEFAEALKSLQKKGMKDLILDLQGNGGGYLNAAIDLANEFLKQKELIVYTEGRAARRSDFFAKGTGNFKNGRLIILVDEYSASASEIVTGAIQDWDRGVVVGRRTFGKGLVQRPIDLPDGSMIRLTIARYYTPSGRCIQKPYDSTANLDGRLTGENSQDKYNQELIDRFNHGEMIHADSIHFADSLKAQTKRMGRTVYGGGGIMPDFFVPIDTTQYTDYHRNLVAKGVVIKATTGYIEKHRKELQNKYKKFEAFNEKFEIDDNFLAEIRTLADKEKIKFDEKQYNQSLPLIKTQLKALIARDLWDMNEYFQVMNSTNQSVQQALKVLNEGIYSTIIQ